jgi:hypothetical protein
MPKFKRNVSRAEDRQPIGVYDGPLPEDATYAAIVRSVKIRTAKTGLEGYNVFFVLDSHNKDGQHADYDGYPNWATIWMADNETSESREKSFLVAICGKAEAEIITDDKPQGDPVVTKIGGKSPNGARILVRLETDRENPQFGQSGTWIYPDPKGNSKVETKDEPADDTADDLDIEAEAKVPAARKRTTKKAAASNVTPIRSESEPEAEAGEADYDSMTLMQIRQAATAAGLEVKGVSKGQLLQQLKEQAAGGERDESKKNPQDIHKMSEGELREFVESLGYGADDFDGMNREEVVQLLHEEGDINPF